MPKHEIKTPDYTTSKGECKNVRGIMTLIRNDVQAHVKNFPFGDVDMQEIDVLMTKNTTRFTISFVQIQKFKYLYMRPTSRKPS